jgi:hypothetical protein
MAGANRQRRGRGRRGIHTRDGQLLDWVDGSKVVSERSTQTEKQAGTKQSSCAEHVCRDKAIKQLKQTTLILV